MCGKNRTGLIGLGAVLIAVLVPLLVASCSASERVRVPGQTERYKTAAVDRAERRAYDGAPPVVPHDPLGIECTECHNARGKAVEGLGFAPPSPHEETRGMSAISRCQQCHVFRQTEELQFASDFEGRRQRLDSGRGATPGAPPTIPHRTFMRENCFACHDGPAAREEVRCDHPERARCRQCHVETGAFE